MNKILETSLVDSCARMLMSSLVRLYLLPGPQTEPDLFDSNSPEVIFSTKLCELIENAIKTVRHLLQ
jgi:hypothetical protein